MRCPDCTKFVSMETGDPEVNNVEVDDSGHVTAEVRIVRNCADCGTELKSADFTLEGDVDAEFADAHSGEGHTLEAEEGDSEATERSEGRGRGLRSFYGVELQVNVKCGCKAEEADETSITLADEMQASAMDECV